MKTFALRLKPNQDLKEELIKFSKLNNIHSGFILTCVGSLKKAVLRLADLEVKPFNENFEIVSLTGTICLDEVHLHISIADRDGKVIGGHIKEGCIIFTTAEIIIGLSEDFVLSREFDKITNFKELVINLK